MEGVLLGTDAFDIVSTLGEPFGSAVSSPSTDLDAEDNPHGYMSLVANNVLWLEGNGPGIRVANEQALIIGNHISEPADNGIELATSTGDDCQIIGNQVRKTSNDDNGIVANGLGSNVLIAHADSGTESRSARSLIPRATALS